jgi:hypothetical protein
MLTHIEVLWRTLIADTWDGGQHPAPVDAGFGFADALVRKMKTCFLARFARVVDDEGMESDIPNFADGKEKCKVALQERFRIFQLFAESEPEVISPTHSSVTERLDESSKIPDATDSISNLPKSNNVKEKIRQFLPKFKTSNDVMDYKFDRTRYATWNLQFRHCMRGRKLFRTAEYSFLGSGAESLKVGDSVCVLAGGKVPYIIRPLDGGAGTRYRFVGEAYVHGMMHGEAADIMREKGERPADIILV